MGRDSETQFQTYLKERELLLREIWDTHRGLDRSLLTLASGAIAISLLLLQQLGSAAHTWLLLASWAVLFGCIASVLFSLRASTKAFTIALKDYETALRTGERAPITRKATTLVHRLNSISMSCYLAGVAVLLAFVFFNMEGL